MHFRKYTHEYRMFYHIVPVGYESVSNMPISISLWLYINQYWQGDCRPSCVKTKGGYAD